VLFEAAQTAPRWDPQQPILCLVAESGRDKGQILKKHQTTRITPAISSLRSWFRLICPFEYSANAHQGKKLSFHILLKTSQSSNIPPCLKSGWFFSIFLCGSVYLARDIELVKCGNLTFSGSALAFGSANF
jgi:hypothetical protein